MEDLMNEVMYKMPMLREGGVTQKVIDAWEDDIISEPESAAEYYYFAIYYFFCDEDYIDMQNTECPRCCQIAISRGIHEAYYILARFYSCYTDDENKIFSNALKAVNLNVTYSDCFLADLYLSKNDIDNVLKYYLLGMERKNYLAILKLAEYYSDKDNEKFEHYYNLLFLENKSDWYIIHLAEKLINIQKLEKAKKLLRYHMEMNIYGSDYALKTYIVSFIDNIDEWLPYFLKYKNILDCDSIREILEFLKVDLLTNRQIIVIYNILDKYEIDRIIGKVNYHKLLKRYYEILPTDEELLCKIVYHLDKNK